MLLKSYFMLFLLFHGTLHTYCPSSGQTSPAQVWTSIESKFVKKTNECDNTYHQPSVTHNNKTTNGLGTSAFGVFFFSFDHLRLLELL